jgi:phospholipid/cholesterol/gamma-HCH transport system substrate-binding protein
MKIKFNKFERIAGLFVGVAILGFAFATIGVGIKKGWFSSKVSYFTMMPSAEGVHPGSTVQISGLRAGSIDEVDLISSEQVKIQFSVLEKYSAQIKKDSVVQVFRPFIIGEKVLEISVGSESEPRLEAQSEIPLHAGMDIMDFLSGRNMGSMLSTFQSMAESLKIFGEAFANPERSRALVGMIDHLLPLIKNLNSMSMQVVKVTDTALKEKRLETMMSNLSDMTREMNTILPQFAKEAPDMGHQMGQIVQNLNILTAEFRKLTPAINEIAPDLPRTSRRAVEALDETVVLLKAMQRSFLLRGNVRDVKNEEEKRAPANNVESK